MTAATAKLATALSQAEAVVVLTGAGVSAESGVPTFRDAQTGLWSRYRPADLATPEAFARDPALVWRWYESRRQTLRSVHPNAGHSALAQLQAKLPSFTLITQNVDCLHQQAGSTGVIEFHGNIQLTVCSDRACQGKWQAGDEREPPVCPLCGELLRPAVVWFGEAIPAAAMVAATAAVASCDLFMAIGTSALVYPAAGLASAAAANGALVAEINPATTPLSASADLCVVGRSAQVLPAVVAAL